MKANTQSVKVVRIINVPPQEVFEVFAYECRLREWMSDGARTQPRKGGLFEVRWNSGYEARGLFTAWKPPSKLAFTWNSVMEPGETTVQVTLKPVEGGTKVMLTHSGFGAGKKWAGRAEECEREWNGGLDNLKSTLETGVDLRELGRPRIGVGFETAEGNVGVLLTAVISGSPAELAGLCKGDVIVRMGGRKVSNQDDFIAIFSSCRAGQRVPVTFLREGKRQTVTVELGTRPMPEIPDDPAVLVEQVRKVHEQAIAALRASVMALTDEQAGMPPAEGEWSVNQVLAHLSGAERGFHAWVANVLIGEQTPITGNLPEQFAAILAAAPTASALADRFERDLVESRVLVASLTPDAQGRRANKWRNRQIAQMLVAFGPHTQDHIGQIQKAIQTIKT